MAQYLNYAVYKDKMYGLNVLLAENKYKTIAMCTFSELSEGKRDKVFSIKDTFNFPLESEHTEIIYQLRDTYTLAIKVLNKVEERDEIEWFNSFVEAEIYRNGYKEMIKEEEKNNKTKVKIEDVILNEDTKHEITQVIDFISKREKYTDMGCKIPTGYLLYGKPGTGKSLIAKAISNKCGCYFKSYCGGEFANKYVGIGADNIRKMFEEARKNAPSIIFIDELDALVMKRHSESNGEDVKMITQLLTEMDGLNTTDDVFVIGSTNAMHLMDDAILREGRFDRKIKIDEPNYENRVKIFELYLGKMKCDDTIDCEKYAKLTEGCNGARIAAICNEAGILAVDRDKEKISDDEVVTMMEKILSFNQNENVMETKRTIGFGTV